MLTFENNCAFLENLTPKATKPRKLDWSLKEDAVELIVNSHVIRVFV